MSAWFLDSELSTCLHFFIKVTVLLQQYQCVQVLFWLKPVVRWFLEVYKSRNHGFHTDSYY